MTRRPTRCAAVLAGLALTAMLASCGTAPASVGHDRVPAEANHESSAQPSVPTSPPQEQPPSKKPSTDSSRTPEASEPTEPSEPPLKPGKALWSEGSQGEEVRELQARLKQIGWFDPAVSGYYGVITTESIKGFQVKREIPVTGQVDRRTWERLVAMTRPPTAEEMADKPAMPDPGTLDARCLTGRVMCIDKSTNQLSWVVDGQMIKVMDARFGCQGMETREGVFSVGWKSRDHVSTIYGSAMPFAMFFSGGQAVHYSSDFAARGWNGCSHGCVNIRDRAAVAWLFDQVVVGDKVVVHW